MKLVLLILAMLQRLMQLTILTFCRDSCDERHGPPQITSDTDLTKFCKWKCVESDSDDHNKVIKTNAYIFTSEIAMLGNFSYESDHI